MKYIKQIDDFVRNESQTSRLRVPTLIVVVTGIVAGIQSLLVVIPVIQTVNDQTVAIATLPYLMSILGSALTPIIIWFLYAVLFHYVPTLLLDRDGELRDTFCLVAWGFVPRALGELLALAPVYWGSRSVAHPSNVETIEQYLLAFNDSTGYLLSELVVLPFLLVSGLIWTLILKRNYELSMVHASVISGAVISLETAWIVYSLL